MKHLIWWCIHVSETLRNGNDDKACIKYPASKFREVVGLEHSCNKGKRKGSEKIGLGLRDVWPYQNGWIFGKIPNGLWPPLIFGKSYCGFRDKMRQKCVCSLWRDFYNINVLYDPISHEMHVVQQFNMVIGWKTYPEKTLLYHFHAEKALFKGPNFAI